MTTYPSARLEDRFAATYADLKARVAVLEQQITAMISASSVFAASQVYPGGIGVNTGVNAGIAVVVDCGADGHRGLVIFANSASQSASLLALQNASFADQLTVDKAGNISAQGSLDIALAGQGLKVAEGSNAKQGTAVLVGGSKVVANTAVTASSRIILTSQVDGGTPGFLRVSTRTAGTSFTIKSSSGTDTSTVAYQIFEPG